MMSVGAYPPVSAFQPTRLAKKPLPCKEDERPIYVNEKQYKRICKMREKREKQGLFIAKCKNEKY